jgi:hypothetical protein
MGTLQILFLFLIFVACIKFFRGGESMYRQGTVIYLTNPTSLKDEHDEQLLIGKLKLDPQLTVFAATQNGYDDLENASWRLLTRGAKNIQAIRATVDAHGDLQIEGPALRLYG